jgi:hypothetical protein
MMAWVIAMGKFYQLIQNIIAVLTAGIIKKKEDS